MTRCASIATSNWPKRQPWALAVAAVTLVALAAPADAQPGTLSAAGALDICLSGDLAAATKLADPLGWQKPPADEIELFRSGYLWLELESDSAPAPEAVPEKLANLMILRKGIERAEGEIFIEDHAHGWNCYVRGVPADALVAQLRQRLGAPTLDKATETASYREWDAKKSNVGVSSTLVGGVTRSLLTIIMTK